MQINLWIKTEIFTQSWCLKTSVPKFFFGKIMRWWWINPIKYPGKTRLGAQNSLCPNPLWGHFMEIKFPQGLRMIQPRNPQIWDQVGTRQTPRAQKTRSTFGSSNCWRNFSSLIPHFPGFPWIFLPLDLLILRQRFSLEKWFRHLIQKKKPPKNPKKSSHIQRFPFIKSPPFYPKKIFNPGKTL